MLFHVLLILAWVAAESVIERERRGKTAREDERFVFEVVETPDYAPDEEPESPTVLVSDKSTRAADTDPRADRSRDIPYSPGDVALESAGRTDGDEAAPGDEGRREPPPSDMAALDIVPEGDGDGRYPISAGSREFKNLVSSLSRRGGVSFNTYEWDFAPYMLAMKRKVERNLHPPYAFTHMGIVSGINILHFTVLRDGTVRDLTILASDTHSSLDRTSVRAIQLSMPFMPLPDDFPEDALEVTAQFSYVAR